MFTNFDNNDETLQINQPQLKKLKKEYDQMELVIENNPEQKERTKTALAMLKKENVVNYTPRRIRHLYPGRIIKVEQLNNETSFINALEKYRTARLLQEFENGSKYNSLFGWSWFFVQNSDVKRSAAKKLAEYKKGLDNCNFKNFEAFTDDEMRALKTDSLGELLKSYGCDEDEINRIQRELIGLQNNENSVKNYNSPSNSKSI